MGFWSRFANAFRRQSLEQDITDELAFHLEERERANRQRGMSPEQAHLAARREFGNLTRVAERTSESDLVQFVSALARDIRLALRLLIKSPAFTCAALVTLALGIGANTAVFTLMKLIVMDALPVQHPEELVVLHDAGPQYSSYGFRMGNAFSSAFSYPLYRDLSAGTGQIFSGIVARAQGPFTTVTFNTPNHAARISAELVSGNYFSVFGVRPWRGRLISERDNDPQSTAAVVLSYAFWQREFGGDPAIIHRTVRLNGFPFVVAGISPPRFYGVDLGETTDVYVPIGTLQRLSPGKEDPLVDRNYAWLTLIARLKPGVGMQQAQAAVGVIYPPLRDKQLAHIKAPPYQGFLQNFERQYIELSPGGKGYSGLRDELEKPLQYVFAMTAIFLLITVVNVANLLIARGSRRGGEMAVRLSLGAPRLALFRQLLIESCVLCGVGGLLGIVLAYAGTPSLLKQFSPDLSQAGMVQHPDGFVLALSLILGVVCGLLCGIGPAVLSTRVRVSENLKREAATHTQSSSWGRRTLIAGQVALSFVLLASALLLTTSLQNLRHVDVGFRTDHLIRFKIDPSAAGYQASRAPIFTEEVRQDVRRLPGVANVGIALTPLMENSDGGFNISIEGYQPPTHADSQSRNDRVSPSFFSTMQIPLVAGHVFTDADMQHGDKVAVVNETFLRHFCAGRNPIGIHFTPGGGAHEFLWTIVGVVRDSQYLGIRTHIEPLMYLPYALSPADIHDLTYYVRVRGPEPAVIAGIRNTVHRLDPLVPVSSMSTMSELIDGQLFAERSLSLAADVFAFLACLLAAVGLYGVMAYTVARRRRKFGIRVAIGASPANISRMVLREGIAVGIGGLVIGIPCAFAASRWGQEALFGLQSAKVAIWSAAALGILLITVLTTWFPARAAGAVNPQQTLRDN